MTITTEYQKTGIAQTSRKVVTSILHQSKSVEQNTGTVFNYIPLSKNLNNRVTVTDITVIATDVKHYDQLYTYRSDREF